MDSVSDEELVRRYQRGDAEAFAAFVARHSDRLYRLACVWLRDRSEAEDVVQEVFSRSYSGLLRFRFKSRASTWLIRVERNVCREFNRRRRGDPLGDSVDTIVDPHAQNDAHASNEAIRYVRTLVSELPPRQREVVGLRIFEELSVDDTAHVMGCRPGTVKALLHKAMIKLREKASENEDE